MILSELCPVIYSILYIYDLVTIPHDSQFNFRNCNSFRFLHTMNFWITMESVYQKARRQVFALRTMIATTELKPNMIVKTMEIKE